MSSNAIDCMTQDVDTSRVPASLTTAGDARKLGLEWIARAAIITVAGGLAWYTWGHWGDFQIDCGRELYVPATILKGNLLFLDVWYPYGPLAPYIQALLFWIFGVHLTVLYVLGLALTVGTALAAFEVARQFKLEVVESVVPSVFFLGEAFYPSRHNFVFPYSYAATLGAFLGLWCLYFVTLHTTSSRRFYLWLAAAFASLASLTKLEFGFACLCILSISMIAARLTRRSHHFLADLALCSTAFAPAVAVYGWFIWKFSAKRLFLENWTATPGSYFMRTFARRAMAYEGFRFVPAELLEVAEYAVLAMGLWYILAFMSAFVIQKLELRSWRLMTVPVLLSSLPLAITSFVFFKHAPWGMVVDTRIFARSVWGQPARFLFTFLSQTIFPAGLFLLVIFFVTHAIVKVWKAPSNTLALQEVSLGVYAALVGVRQMMELEPTLYKGGVFFNVPAFLVFVILLDRVVRWASRSLDSKRCDFLAGSMLAAEGVLIFVLFFPRPKILPAPLTTDFGTSYTSYEIATLVPQIISFMKTHTKNGKDFLVIPEPPSLYVFAGMQGPTRWHQLMPGLVPPEREQEYITQLEANNVRYILIANRSLDEYGIKGFVDDGYNHAIYRWIMANYAKVGQFGPQGKLLPPRAFVMWIYERKDAKSKPQND